MRKHEFYTDYQDHLEYFGSTEIERICKKGEKAIRHDWIIFDTVDEAMEFFNDKCGEFFGYYALDKVHNIWHCLFVIRESRTTNGAKYDT